MQLVDDLSEDKRVAKIDIAGSLRRRRETIGDVDIVCAVDDPKDAAAIAGLCTDCAHSAWRWPTWRITGDAARAQRQRPRRISAVTYSP